MNEMEVLLAKSGNEDAIESLFIKFKKDILRNNKNFFIKGADNDDLLQEGYIGLMKAIKSYDNSKDVTFSTFANLCIKRQIITAIKSSNSIKNQSLNKSISGDSDFDFNDLVEYSRPSIKYSSPEDILLGKELAYLLNEYLKENLTTLEKKVCSYMYKQYKYNEIAEILDESPKKIDNAIQRVRKKVLEYLGTYAKK